MTQLYINTINKDWLEIKLIDGKKIIAQAKFLAKQSQAEKLLPAIDKLLKKNKISLADLSEIKVANAGRQNQTSFTALRIAVVTANALGYGLGIPVNGEQGTAKVIHSQKGRKFNVVKPVYGRKPDISYKVHKVVSL